MRVGIIHYGLDREAGGIARYTSGLAGSLAGQDVTVHPLWAGRCPANAAGSSLRWSYLLPGLLTVGQLEIADRARRQALDLVHDPTGVMPLLLTRASRVLTIHDAIPYVYPETSTRLDRLIYHVWLPYAVRAADAVLTDSHQSREDIVKHLAISPEKVAIVPLAAARSFRPVADAAVRQTLSKYDVTQPYLLYVGALAPRKNLPRLLAAYAQLRSWSTRWTLVIVGAQKWRSSPIFETVQRLELEPYMHFTGYVDDDDLPALYAGADLFAFPSLYEGFGLPVLEAMACGTPVVTSNTSSLPDVAGDAAILVDPYDVDAIADAMRRVLSDPALAQDLRERGLVRSAQFSWERTARETVAVYEKALGRRTS